MKRIVACSSVIFAILCVAEVRAEIGDRKTFVFGADRVMGFTSSKTSIDLEGPTPDTTITRTNLSLLSQQAVVSPYTNPRFAFDYFVTNGLSLGGTIGYWSLSAEDEDRGDLGDQHLFTFGPRVGYGVMFGRVVGIWPRGGLTFFTGEGGPSVPAGSDVSGLGLNLDVPFVFVPMNHFAILAGPGLDLTITGSGETVGGADYDLSIFDIGLHVGFVGYI